MKRFFLLLVLLSMLAGVAFAEIDLESMTFDELTALQLQISEELVQRPEMKEQVYHSKVDSIVKDFYGIGVHLIYCNQDGVYWLPLGKEELIIGKTAAEERLEQIGFHAANIKLEYDQESVDEAKEQIKELQKRLVFP